MEGVGARLGRSTTRYGGPTTVFTGPVRKWKKKWVHVPPPNSSHHRHTAANATVNGSKGSSHLLLYKWTPMAPSQTKDSNDNDNNNNGNNSNADNRNSNKDDGVAADEPLKKKFKYIPIIVLEEQKDESLEQMEDETNPSETDPNAAEATTKSDGHDEKPDINDVPVNENQASENNPDGRHDINANTLDLSLGLKAAHDGGNISNSKADQIKGNQ